MLYKLKENSIFISDSHDNENKLFFLSFLKDIKDKKIQCSQIFFMGDMFDYLSYTDYSVKFYKEQIDLVNEISKDKQCYYFEGNHDFNIKELFPNLKVFPIQEQPVKFALENGKTAQLSHGDKYLPFIDEKFMLFIRNKTFLNIMNFIDKIFCGFITKKILNAQKNKKLYTKFENFKEVVEKKIHNYNADYVIEGHYHQDFKFDFKNVVYVNLNSFAVTQKIYRTKFENNNFVLMPEILRFNKKE